MKLVCKYSRTFWDCNTFFSKEFPIYLWKFWENQFRSEVKAISGLTLLKFPSRASTWCGRYTPVTKSVFLRLLIWNARWFRSNNEPGGIENATHNTFLSQLDVPNVLWVAFSIASDSLLLVNHQFWIPNCCYTWLASFLSIHRFAFVWQFFYCRNY
jgi:hypothetical protein